MQSDDTRLSFLRLQARSTVTREMEDTKDRIHTGYGELAELGEAHLRIKTSTSTTIQTPL